VGDCCGHVISVGVCDDVYGSFMVDDNGELW